MRHQGDNRINAMSQDGFAQTHRDQGDAPRLQDSAAAMSKGVNRFKNQSRVGFELLKFLILARQA